LSTTDYDPKVLLTTHSPSFTTIYHDTGLLPLSSPLSVASCTNKDYKLALCELFLSIVYSESLTVFVKVSLFQLFAQLRHSRVV